MKKLVIFLTAACLLLSMAGCNASDVGSTTENTAGNPASDDTTAEPGVTTGCEEEFVFTYNGVEIKMHAPAEPIVTALGDPKTYTEEASCAFEGLDKTYYYGSFYLDTYPDGDKDFVYGFWFADDSVTTEEGIYIGCTQAQVEAAYGADSYNGTNAYIVTRGNGKLTVILEAGVVSSIQYEIVMD